MAHSAINLRVPEMRRMRLISGTLRSTPLPWLPVLSNIEPSALRRKEATDKLVEKIVKQLANLAWYP